jgi:hypothetical protein
MSTSLFTITSSIRYLLAPGNTRLAILLTTINNSPMKTTFLRGHINSLKACEIDTEDLGVLMTTILITAKVSAEWHG